MKKQLYTITEKSHNYFINGIKIDSEVCDQKNLEYWICDREEQIDNLIMWISECRKPSDKPLMKADLKMLIKIKDKYILSSNSTNSYLYGNSKDFNEFCKEILEANE